MTSLREVCFLIGQRGEVLWYDTNDNPGYLEDRRDRWEAIWSNRDNLAVIAHSHPAGPDGFSAEDESTMHALVAALGCSLTFAVVAPHVTVVRSVWKIGRELDSHDMTLVPSLEPAWAGWLRESSGMAPRGTLQAKAPAMRTLADRIRDVLDLDIMRDTANGVLDEVQRLKALDGEVRRAAQDMEQVLKAHPVCGPYEGEKHAHLGGFVHGLKIRFDGLAQPPPRNPGRCEMITSPAVDEFEERKCGNAAEVAVDFGNKSTTRTCRPCAEKLVAHDPEIVRGVLPLGSPETIPCTTCNGGGSVGGGCMDNGRPVYGCRGGACPHEYADEVTCPTCRGAKRVGACPNCGQWQLNGTLSGPDCFNECRARGFVPPPAPPGSDAYYDQMSDIIEQHPPGMPGVRR